MLIIILCMTEEEMIRQIAEPILKQLEKIEKELGICKADTNAQVVDFADIVFLAVKPQFLEGVLDEIKDSVKENQIFQGLTNIRI